jgi:hypothetical protein
MHNKYFNCVSGADMEDPDDPTVIAENELLGAAASIDAAAKKLASLRPRRSVQVSRVLLACVSLWVAGAGYLVLSSRACPLRRMRVSVAASSILYTSHNRPP